VPKLLKTSGLSVTTDAATAALAALQAKVLQIQAESLSASAAEADTIVQSAATEVSAYVKIKTNIARDVIWTLLTSITSQAEQLIQDQNSALAENHKDALKQFRNDMWHVFEVCSCL
jgi:Holliday junction resolvase-like predicted endonuclease